MSNYQRRRSDEHDCYSDGCQPFGPPGPITYGDGRPGRLEYVPDGIRMHFPDGFHFTFGWPHQTKVTQEDVDFLKRAMADEGDHHDR